MNFPGQGAGRGGLVADPHAVPGLWGVLDMLTDALGELSALAAGG